jgi:hypothetical protein
MPVRQATSEALVKSMCMKARRRSGVSGWRFRKELSLEYLKSNAAASRRFEMADLRLPGDRRAWISSAPSSGIDYLRLPAIFDETTVATPMVYRLRKRSITRPDAFSANMVQTSIEYR